MIGQSPRTTEYPRKLADASSFHRRRPDGLKLIGFSVWSAAGRRPERQVSGAPYSVNGERARFRCPAIADATAQDRIREVILEAYTEYEEKAAVAT